MIEWYHNLKNPLTDIICARLLFQTLWISHKSEALGRPSHDFNCQLGTMEPCVGIGKCWSNRISASRSQKSISLILILFLCFCDRSCLDPTYVSVPILSLFQKDPKGLHLSWVLEHVLQLVALLFQKSHPTQHCSELMALTSLKKSTSKKMEKTSPFPSCFPRTCVDIMDV